MGRMTECTAGRTFGKALKCRQGLATVPLLNADMDVVRLRSNVLGAAKRVSLVCEGICMLVCTESRRKVKGAIDKPVWPEGGRGETHRKC